MYQEIKPLSDREKGLSSAELSALAEVWHEKKVQLAKSDAYQDFLKKLHREWAIETGIIERLYNWDRGVTQVLIEQGIDSTIIAHRAGLTPKKAEGVTGLIQDQLTTVEGLFTFIKGEQPLSEHYIRCLHDQLTVHQDTTTAYDGQGRRFEVNLLKGQYKKNPNNPKRGDEPTHLYCPPEKVQDEMAFLVTWYAEYEDEIAPDVLSAWIHHRFTQIHPFQDGNGRVARALASLVFIKANNFPLVVRDTDRKAYIAGLEEADKGDLGPLIQYFARRQKASILKALGLEQQVSQAGRSKAIIASTLTLLKNKAQEIDDRVEQVYVKAQAIHQKAWGYLEKLKEDLDQPLAEVTPFGKERYHVTLHDADNQSSEGHYFRHQIISLAKEFDYYANLNTYKSWLRLSIRTDINFEIVLSFHGYGPGKTGIIVASVFSAVRIPREEGGTEVVDTRAACTDHFQFNYAEPDDSIFERFSDWLEDSISIGLAEWSRHLSG